MAPTLQEIANLLNVSTATVSRALNGKPGVSSKTRNLILGVASELNYTPNPVAQSLATKKTYAVAFVIKRWLVRGDNPFYDVMMTGAEQEFEKHGYHLVAITIDEKNHGTAHLPPGLDKRRLDGLIVAGCELSNRVISTIHSLNLPVVLAGNWIEHLPIDAVTSANKEGGYLATKHLIEHGHEHILFLCGPKEWSPVYERMDGYRKAIHEHNLSEYIVCRPDLKIASGHSALIEGLQTYPKVDAVFTSNDPMAIGVIQAARDLKLSVPEDLAIIGFDNVPWSETADPPLSTINIHKTQIGKLAARRLIELVDEGHQPPICIRVANELIARKSCGCAMDISVDD